MMRPVAMRHPPQASPMWQGSRYQVTQATPMQRYSRAMAVPVLRQVMPAGMVPPGRPRAAMVTIRTATPIIPPGPLMRSPQGWTQQKMIQNQPLQLQNQAPQNATMNPQLMMNQPPAQTVTGHNGVYSSYYFPRVDYPMFQNQHQLYNMYQASESTSTAPPITSPTVSTTSTMPPYPGGIKPDSDDHSGSFLLCGNKAKCNKYVWTTKKKSATKKLKEEELVLW